MPGINVPIGPAIVEYGDVATKVVFDITKGGITFAASTSVQEVKVDQFGEATVKAVTKGTAASVTVPFALHDLDKLAKVMPNAKLTTSGTGATMKKKLVVSSQAGIDLLAAAKKLVIKPTDPAATANDWITIPLAGSMADPEYTYNTENERIVKITFTAFPDVAAGGALYILGDETATGV